jgi:hypothetical protein
VEEEVVPADMITIQEHNFLPQQEVLVDLVEGGADSMQILLKQVLMDLEHQGKEMLEELEMLALRLLEVAAAVAVQGTLEQMLLELLEEAVGQVLLQVLLDLR